MKIKSGDSVLLLAPDNRTFLLKVESDKDFHTHKGILNFNNIIGKEYGDSVISSLDHNFIILEPTVDDKMMKVRRLTQIIYPKDAALIILKSSISPGARVIECGVGSGALTIGLANAVAPNGKVFSYDKREDFIENARKNVDEAGYSDFVEYKLRDCREGFEEQEVDAVILDLPSPWDGIKSAYKSLKGGGRIASLSPTLNQIEKATECFKDEGFVYLETFEILLRGYQVLTGKTRPRDRMIGHTGFITVGRKANAK